MQISVKDTTFQKDLMVSSFLNLFDKLKLVNFQARKSDFTIEKYNIR